MPLVTIPNTEAHLLKSRHTGREYRVSIALPESYAADPQKAYPALYLVDANLVFGTCINTARLMAMSFEVPELIIVGIDNPVDSLLASTRLRNRDLTPVHDAHIEQIMAMTTGDEADAATGGAAGYLEFIREEVLPFVDERFRTEPGDRAYFGDSLGGLFGYYVLFHKPDTFQRYILGSPSLWYGEEISFAYEESYAQQHADLPARIFTAVGGLEERPDVPAMLPFKMVSNTTGMADKLRARGYPGLTITHHIFEGETHGSVPASILSRGLRTVYDAPPSPPEMAAMLGREDEVMNDEVKES